MTPQERLQIIQELKNPSLKEKRLLEERLNKIESIQPITGSKGDKGDTGPQGLPGIKGDKGDKGEKGVIGDTGPQGIKGDKGVQGDKGERGEQGIAGKDGKDGISPSIDDVIIRTKEEIKKDPIDFKDLKGTEGLVKFLKSGGFRGGGGISNITGLIQHGTNITITGTGTAGDPYIINGSAGGVTSFNTRTGAVTLTSGDVTGALTFTPYNSTNPAGYITSASLTGYVPYTGATNDLNLGAHNFSLSGSILQTGAYSRFGNALPWVSITTGVDVAGNDNTINGVQIGSTNRNSGTSAYNGYSLNNDLASDLLVDHYCFVGQNSSTYSDTTFGTLFAVPNQMQVQNTDGDIVIVAQAVGKKVSIATGGNSTTNKRITVADTDISTTVSINGVSVASQQTGSFGASFNGLGGVIANGNSTSITMQYAGSISGWYLSSISGNVALSGSCTIAIKKNGTDIIGAGIAPTLTSQSSNSGTNMASWTTSFVAGDVFIITINSVTTCQNVSLTMKATKL